MENSNIDNSQDIVSSHLATQQTTSIIKVIGVGSAGLSAVLHMYNADIKGVEFMVCCICDGKFVVQNISDEHPFDEDAFTSSSKGTGKDIAEGEEITRAYLPTILGYVGDHIEMVFLAAGMGGGTSSGGAPIIAEALKNAGKLTVGIVTFPFRTEGLNTIRNGAQGVGRMKDCADALIVIKNDILLDEFGDLPESVAFQKADDVWVNAAKGISELITIPDMINLDFEDIRTVLTDGGLCLMGTGTASGANRASSALKAALGSPFLSDSMGRRAKNAILSIRSGVGDYEMRIDDVTEISIDILSMFGDDSAVIWGVGMDAIHEDKFTVTVVGTGLDVSDIYSYLSLDHKALNSLSISGRPAPVPVSAPVPLSSPVSAPVPASTVGNSKPTAPLYDWEEDSKPLVEEKPISVDYDDLPENKSGDISVMRDDLTVEEIQEMERIPAIMRRKRS